MIWVYLSGWTFVVGWIWLNGWNLPNLEPHIQAKSSGWSQGHASAWRSTSKSLVWLGDSSSENSAKLCQNLAILCYHIRKKSETCKTRPIPKLNMKIFMESRVKYSWTFKLLQISTQDPLVWSTLMLRRLAPRTCGQAQNAGCWVTGGLLSCPVNVCSLWQIIPWNPSGSAQGQEVRNQWRRQSFKCCRVKSLNVRLCGQKVQASSGTMSKRVKTSLHKQLV